jgi:hypothetical protein
MRWALPAPGFSCLCCSSLRDRSILDDTAADQHASSALSAGITIEVDMGSRIPPIVWWR